LKCRRVFKAGDRVRISGAEHMAVTLDPAVGESLLYTANKILEVAIPFLGQDGRVYPPQLFAGDTHCFSARPVVRRDLDAYRNLARNSFDVRGAAASWPHATSNSECRNDPVFAARNAIDGRRDNDGHGAWPHQSWGPEKATNAWWQVDFGRTVRVDRVVITLRADFPHDQAWSRATLVFSGGARRVVDLKPIAEPQVITFSKPVETDSLRLQGLMQDGAPGWCALSEVEAWGRDAVPVGLDLEAPVEARVGESGGVQAYGRFSQNSYGQTRRM